jgi:cell wall-associated NlpC family hydrolase
MGQSVSESELQPGDLVFFGDPAYHVGMYVGAGKMVAAPTEGEPVKVDSLADQSDYSGARRLAG